MPGVFKLLIYNSNIFCISQHTSTGHWNIVRTSDITGLQITGLEWSSIYFSVFRNVWIRFFTILGPQKCDATRKSFWKKNFLILLFGKSKNRLTSQTKWHHKQQQTLAFKFWDESSIFSSIGFTGQFMYTDCVGFLKSFQCGFILCFRKSNLISNSLFWFRSESKGCGFNEAVFSFFFNILNATYCFIKRSINGETQTIYLNNKTTSPTKQQLDEMYLLLSIVIWKWSN